MLKKITLICALSTFPVAAKMEVITQGYFTNFVCANIMNLPNNTTETSDFQSNYYSNMKYMIYTDSTNFYLTTDLYSGVFKTTSSTHPVFYQIYGDGSDVAVLSINMKLRKLTYSNNGGQINRLCTADIVVNN